MVDVTRVPANGFGYVPTPALVAPIEFTLTLSDYAALGGHMEYGSPIEFAGGEEVAGAQARPASNCGESVCPRFRREMRRIVRTPMREPRHCRLLPDGRRMHFHDGPIDLMLEGLRRTPRSRDRVSRSGAALQTVCSTTFAPNCRCSARCGNRQRTPARSRRTSNGRCRGSFCLALVYHSDGRRGRRRRRRNSCGHDQCCRARARLRERWRRYRPASHSGRIVQHRHDRAPGSTLTLRHRAN